MKIFILLSLSLCILSCNHKSKTGILIPRDKFKDILIHLNMVDGFYVINYNNLSSIKDTNYYNQVIKKYGYNRVQFDSTLRYYTRAPKKFDALCDEIITDMQKIERELYLINSFDTDSASNLYKGKKHWNLPRDGIVTKIPFSIAIRDTGNYTINVRLKILPEDNSKNPRLTAYFWYKDGSKDGHREYFPEVPYKIGTELTLYKTAKRCLNKKFTHIKGYILDYDYNKASYHFAEVKNIYVRKGY